MTYERIASTGTSSLQLLFSTFVVWKTLIILIVCLSPGIGYDTSSDLLTHPTTNLFDHADVPPRIDHKLLSFVRWDAIYYTQASQRDHIYEQEWAFGKGLATVLRLVVQGLGLRYSNGILNSAVAGILVSCISHWLSVVLLFFLTAKIQDVAKSGSNSVPLVAALLHIISPGGVFLTAPYSESLFSFLNMLGFWFYTESWHNPHHEISARSLFSLLFSGLAFGGATMIRGNGILSGIPFFIDALETTFSLLNPNNDSSGKPRQLLKLQFVILGGICVAVGMVIPQYLAYKEYCVGGPEDRPWCKQWIPSIFAFVQSFYWNVGFLKYWTLSNIPLFILAVPCLYLLMMSGIHGTRPGLSFHATSIEKLHLRIALPQLVLSILALTSYHVQIITRLASGYPFWYFWIATRFNTWNLSEWTVRIMVMYALIQAALFASFLPPA